MTGEAPDVREQGDCPGADTCGSSCDQHAPMTGDVRLTEAEAVRIVHASLHPGRVLAGRDGHDGGPSDVLLDVVREVIATRLAEVLSDDLAQDLTYATIRHYGYSDDDIADAESVHPGTVCGEDCYDEDGRTIHSAAWTELAQTAPVMVDVVVPHVERIIAARLGEQRERIAEAIHAAKPRHLTRDYTPVDQAYDNAARIARNGGRDE